MDNQAQALQTKKFEKQQNAVVVLHRSRIFLAILTCAIFFISAVNCFAKEPPDAPSSSIMARPGMSPAMFTTPAAPVSSPEFQRKIVDKKFVALAIVSTGSTFADSFTTMFATQNWRAGKQGVCNIEKQSPYLYGTHPTTARVYTVASAKSVGMIASAYFLRKHHSRFWSLPFIGNTALSLDGVSQNLVNCN